MELREVEKVLEAYFEGETSLQEEQQLSAYFTGNQVAAHLEEYVPLFSAFAKAETATYDAPINLPSKQPFKIPVWMRIAAVLAICFGVFSQLYKPDNSSGNEVTGTYKQEEAILKTRQALGFVSQMLNQSTAQLDVVKEFDNATSNFIKE